MELKVVIDKLLCPICGNELDGFKVCDDSHIWWHKCYNVKGHVAYDPFDKCNIEIGKEIYVSADFTMIEGNGYACTVTQNVEVK